MSINISELLQPVIKLAETTAAEVLKIYNSEFAIQQKDDKTPLTSADLAAHEALLKGLTELTPEIPILSEEGSKFSFEQRQQWNQYWLVDPIDGTREFIKRNGEFTINIALIENHLPILGVILVPVSGTCYYAIKNKGAFKQEKNSDPQQITVKKTSIEKVHVAGSRSYLDNSLDDFLNKLPSYDLTKMGSSLKSCLVAEGLIDIYPRLGPTSEWDTAAAQCIVEEAGGHVTTTDMERLRYNTKNSLLNPHFFVFADNSINWQSYI